MKVKINNDVFNVTDGPIMVILTKQDKENIKNMLPHCTKYACFPEDIMVSDEDKRDWMEDDRL